MLAELAIANAAFAVVRESVINGGDLLAAGQHVFKFFDSKSEIAKKANSSGSDSEAFFALEKIKQQEVELRELMQWHGRAGEDCGCTERKDTLNKVFPYKKIECLTEDEYNYLVSQMEKNSNVVTQTVQLRMLKIYNRVFNEKKAPTSCGSCFKSTYNALKALIDEYNN